MLLPIRPTLRIITAPEQQQLCHRDIKQQDDNDNSHDEGEKEEEEDSEEDEDDSDEQLIRCFGRTTVAVAVPQAQSGFRFAHQRYTGNRYR